METFFLMNTGIVKDARYLNHNMGPFHPESPQRLKAIYEMIASRITYPLFAVQPRSASQEEILAVHTKPYFERIQNTAGKERVMLDPDTSTSAQSFETALLAAGGVISALEAIMRKDIKNGFALIRPPGHHAEASRAMGFCLFNNIAIGAEYLLRTGKCSRVLIVDWDLHHGNGTQHAFEKRNDVLYFSTHQFPHYPGTGWWNETGLSAGEGFTVNVPLSPGKTDADYLFIYREILRPVAFHFKPDFILVSAGFDIYKDDPLGGMRVSGPGFGTLATELMSMARNLCSSRLLLVLEGGYHLEGQSLGVQHILDQLAEAVPPTTVKEAHSAALTEELTPAFENMKKYGIKTA